ncbi:MAG: hypothetical protein ACLPSF_04215 [Methylocella sp.]
MSLKATDFWNGSRRRSSLVLRLVLAGLALASLALAGCDKCGDPIKLNTPSIPKSCYGLSEEK